MRLRMQEAFQQTFTAERMMWDASAGLALLPTIAMCAYEGVSGGGRGVPVG